VGSGNVPGLAVVLAPFTVLAQPETVVLELRFAMPGVAYYDGVGTSQVTLGIAGATVLTVM
jgi:hypothetical protein